jgi:pilus assembly protein CpaB
MSTLTAPTHEEVPASRLVRKIRLRALLFFALALVAGAAAVFLVKLYLDRASARAVAPPLSTQPVVVAAADLPIGTALDKVHLATVEWPQGRAPAGAFAAASDVVGRSLTQGVVAGEAILERRLADPARGRGMAAILAPGRRAMSVKVDQVIGVAGFVQPGDFVDVITTMRLDDNAERAVGSGTERMAKTILQNIRVLAIGQELATEGQKPVSVQVVTLEVTPEEAERLALGTQYGKVLLTMRARTDQVAVETEGVTPRHLLAEELVAAPAPAPPPAPVEKVERRSSRSRRASRVAAVVAPAPAPKAPVVEIIRGGKVEERELRPSPDAK